MSPNYFPIPEALVVNLWVFTAMDWCFGSGPHNDAIIICIIGINFAIYVTEGNIPPCSFPWNTSSQALINSL